MRLFGFSRRFRLSDNVAIREAFKHKAASTNGMMLFTVKNGLDHNRYVCTFRRNFATAVQRNHRRRFCKEIFRHINGALKQGYDVVVLFTKSDGEVSFVPLCSLLKKSGMISDEMALLERLPIGCLK